MRGQRIALNLDRHRRGAILYNISREINAAVLAKLLNSPTLEL
jgi:hypothetical protein